MKTEEKKKKLPRGIRRAADGIRFVIYATDSKHKAVRKTVTWKLLKQLGVSIPETSKLQEPGVRFAEQALVALKARYQVEKRTGAVAASAKTRISDLYRLVEDEYLQLGRKSLSDLKERWKNHLKDFFGNLNAAELSSEQISKYIRERLKDGAAAGTCQQGTCDHFAWNETWPAQHTTLGFNHSLFCQVEGSGTEAGILERRRLRQTCSGVPSRRALVTRNAGRREQLCMAKKRSNQPSRPAA